MTTRLTFQFDEESDYGQQVLDLVGLATSLMEADKEYTKTEVKEIAMEVRRQAKRIINNLTLGYVDPAEYVGKKGVE